MSMNRVFSDADKLSMKKHGRLPVRVDFKDSPSLTKQAFADQVDINKIVANFATSGMLTHVNSGEPFYGDVSEFRSYEDSLAIVQRAEDLFAGMSSAVRTRFDNDPLKMVSFLQDPANLDEAIKLGMVVKRPEEPVVEAPVVPGPNV